MRSILFCFIGIISFGHSSAQNLVLKKDNGFLNIENSGTYSLTYLPAEEFNQLDWQPGYAYYLDGSSRQYDGLKYDPEKDIIQVSTQDNILTLLPGVVNGVSMESEGIVNRIFVIVPLDKPVFMEALSVGKIHLLMYRKVRAEELSMYKETDATNLLFEKPEEPPAEFNEILYIWSSQGVEKYKPSKKFILKAMEDQKAEIEGFMDEVNIKLKNPSSLISLFDHYNKL